MNGVFRDQFQRARDDTLHTMLIASLGVVGVAAAVLGWLLAGRALRPLQRITATARRVADRNLHERIALVGVTTIMMRRPCDRYRPLGLLGGKLLLRLTTIAPFWRYTYTFIRWRPVSWRELRGLMGQAPGFDSAARTALQARKELV
jgi:hypothetical protein